MIVNPLRARWKIGWRSRRIELVIHIKAYGLRLPFDGEDMIIACETLLTLQSEWCADTFRAGISRPVNRSMNHRRFTPDVLHDVYLAADRPPDFIYVITEQPEGRPDALTAREFETRLEPPVGLSELLFCHEARGSVAALAVP